MNGHDINRARDALHAIPPDLPRPEWVKAGMAAHAAGLSFDDFDSWSALADCYEAAAARDTWRVRVHGVPAAANPVGLRQACSVT